MFFSAIQLYLNLKAMTIHPPHTVLGRSETFNSSPLFEKDNPKLMIFSHPGSIRFPALSPTAFGHWPNVTWTTWNSPDNVKVPHVFSLCSCRSIACKLLPTSFQAHLKCFTDNATCHTHSYIVFMARSSVIHYILRSLGVETDSFSIFHPVGVPSTWHPFNQQAFRQAFYNGRHWTRCWHTKVDEAQPWLWWGSHSNQWEWHINTWL